MLMDTGKLKKLLKEDNFAFMSAAEEALPRHVAGYSHEVTKSGAFISLDIRGVHPDKMDGTVWMVREYFKSRGVRLKEPEVGIVLADTPVVRRRPYKEEVEVLYLNRRVKSKIMDTARQTAIRNFLKIMGDIEARKYMKQKMP